MCICMYDMERIGGMYVCTYVCVYVCVYVCIYICVCACMYDRHRRYGRYGSQKQLEVWALHQWSEGVPCSSVLLLQSFFSILLLLLLFPGMLSFLGVAILCSCLEGSRVIWFQGLSFKLYGFRAARLQGLIMFYVCLFPRLI